MHIDRSRTKWTHYPYNINVSYTPAVQPSFLKPRCYFYTHPHLSAPWSPSCSNWLSIGVNPHVPLSSRRSVCSAGWIKWLHIACTRHCGEWETTSPWLPRTTPRRGPGTSPASARAFSLPPPVALGVGSSGKAAGPVPVSPVSTEKLFLLYQRQYGRATLSQPHRKQSEGAKEAEMQCKHSHKQRAGEARSENYLHL